MGEYADMAVGDDFDDIGWREPDLRPGRRRIPTAKTCNRCGQTGLVWAQTDDGWRLHFYSDHGHLWGEPELHVCPASPTQSSEDPPLSPSEASTGTLPPAEPLDHLSGEGSRESGE